MTEMTESQLEGLMAHFKPDTLNLMKRDVLQLIQDEPEVIPVEWYCRLLVRIVHMLEEKATRKSTT